MNKERIAQCEDALRRSKEFIALDILEQLERENIELKLLNEKMKTYINRFRELKEENEQLEQEKCELLGIIQKKDELIEKMKQHIGCKGCKHYGKERDCRGCEKCCNGTSCNLELAEE